MIVDVALRRLKRLHFDQLKIEFVRSLSVKALDVNGASTSDGAIIQQWDSIGVPQETFTPELLPGGTWKIVTGNSGKVLDVIANSLVDGAFIDQWTGNGGFNQQSRLIR